MKLMPASRAFATIRDDVASSVGPPNIMVPTQIGEIFRPLRPSWRYCMVVRSSQVLAVIASEAISPRKGRMDCFVASAPRNDASGSSITLHDLKHTTRHRDTALVDGDFGGDENQAAGRAHHMRLRDQDFADLAGLDEMGVELHGRELRFAGDE